MSTKIEKVSKIKKLKNPTLFVGLPGVGLVGKITVDYLSRELNPKTKLFANVSSDTFPPAVHTKNSILQIIKNEIYLYRTKNKDFLFLVGPVQPTLSNPNIGYQHYEFSEKLAEFSKKIGVKEIYTFAGLNIGEKRIKSKPKVLAVCTDLKTIKNLEKKKIKNLYFDKDNKDTLVSGVAGLLPGISYYNYKIPGTCIMGQTDSKLTFGDHGSAKQVLEIIKDIFKLKFSLSKIQKNAKKIENSFNQMNKKIEEMNKKEKDDTSNYIR